MPSSGGGQFEEVDCNHSRETGHRWRDPNCIFVGNQPDFLRCPIRNICFVSTLPTPRVSVASNEKYLTASLKNMMDEHEMSLPNENNNYNILSIPKCSLPPQKKKDFTNEYDINNERIP